MASTSRARRIFARFDPPTPEGVKIYLEHLMKLYILSDLHLEFAPFVPDYDAADAADVIVLAGDIHLGTHGIALAQWTFRGKPVIYVAGNHEFYGSHWDALLPELEEQAARSNVHFLENAAVTIDGIRFLGTTLWTDFEFFGSDTKAKNMALSEARLNDFRLIKAGLAPESQSRCYESDSGLAVRISPGQAYEGQLTAAHTLERHENSRAWLRDEVPKGDPAKTVVITHHFPHQNSCAPQWQNDPLTSIFGSTLPEDVLLSAKLWIHGHTHESCDYRLADAGRTVRIVCNPRGYPLERWAKSVENARFDPALFAEI